MVLGANKKSPNNVKEDNLIRHQTIFKILFAPTLISMAKDFEKEKIYFLNILDNNQFPCECDVVGWLLAYGQHGYNSKSIAEIAKVSRTF